MAAGLAVLVYAVAAPVREGKSAQATVVPVVQLAQTEDPVEEQPGQHDAATLTTKYAIKALHHPPAPEDSCHCKRTAEHGRNR